MNTYETEHGEARDVDSARVINKEWAEEMIAEVESKEQEIRRLRAEGDAKIEECVKTLCEIEDRLWPLIQDLQLSLHQVERVNGGNGKESL